MAEARAQLGVSKVTMAKMVKVAGVETYQDPRDARTKLLRVQDVERMQQPTRRTTPMDEDKREPVTSFNPIVKARFVLAFADFVEECLRSGPRGEGQEFCGVALNDDMGQEVVHFAEVHFVPAAGVSDEDAIKAMREHAERWMRGPEARMLPVRSA